MVGSMGDRDPNLACNFRKTVNPRANLSSASSPLDCVDKLEDFQKATGMHLPTTKELLDAIPESCKKRCLWRSTMMLFRDTLLAVIVTVVWKTVSPIVCGDNCFLHILSWMTYAIVQGTVATGIWVIGHECGHGAYSESAFINNLVGYIVHSTLLVPFWSWQYTHNKHHSYCNHLLWGETHVPPTGKGLKHYNKLWNLLGEDAFAVYMVFVHLLIGWPMYLVFNSTGGRLNWKGRRMDKKGVVDHFRATHSEIFPLDFSWKVTASGLGCFAMMASLALWGVLYGWTLPLKWYVGPYLVVNLWLVLYTWLHHTHPNIPHYGEESFTWLRGSLSTVDRPYPWLVDHLHHHIGTTHVLHHVDFKIPHYHAPEASKCVQKLLGAFYRIDTTSVFKAMWDASMTCHFVDDVYSVQYYKNARDTEMQEQANRKALKGGQTDGLESDHSPKQIKGA